MDVIQECNDKIVHDVKKTEENLYHFHGRSFINLGNIAMFVENESFTFEFWLLVSLISNKHYTKDIIKHYNSTTMRGYAIRITDTNNLELVFMEDDNEDIYTSNIKLKFMSWQHIAISHEHKNTYIYIDGIKDNVTKKICLFDEKCLDELSELHVGSYNGMIDELVIYDEILPEKYIIDRANSERLINIPQDRSIIGIYHMDYKDNNIIIDSSILANHGKVYNREYYIFGKFDQALNFGISDVSYISITSPIKANIIIFKTKSCEFGMLTPIIAISEMGNILMKIENIWYQSKFSGYNDGIIHTIRLKNNTIDHNDLVLTKTKFNIDTNFYGHLYNGDMILTNE